jgi:putative Mn2+ efflux pump MntP
MKIFKSKVWSVVDIGLLKWCCILLGMIIGAYLADFTKRYVWLIAGLAFLMGIKPTISYFRTDGE